MRDILKITSILQAIYMALSLLNVLFIWMFSIGVTYTYPFAITGNVLLYICPAAIPCLIVNLIFFFRKVGSFSKEDKIKYILVISISFVVVSVMKIFLRFYGGDILAGVV